MYLLYATKKWELVTELAKYVRVDSKVIGLWEECFKSELWCKHLSPDPTLKANTLDSYYSGDLITL